MVQTRFGVWAIVLAGAFAVRLVHAGPTGINTTGISWEKPGETAAPAVGAIRWEKSFAAAKARAAKERKPILLLHLFGRLDDGLC